MTDDKMLYYALCAPLEDAVALLDQGDVATAKKLLQRMLEQTKARLRESGL